MSLVIVCSVDRAALHFCLLCESKDCTRDHVLVIWCELVVGHGVLHHRDGALLSQRETRFSKRLLPRHLFDYSILRYRALVRSGCGWLTVV